MVKSICFLAFRKNYNLQNLLLQEARVLQILKEVQVQKEMLEVLVQVETLEGEGEEQVVQEDQEGQVDQGGQDEGEREDGKDTVLWGNQTGTNLQNTRVSLLCKHVHGPLGHTEPEHIPFVVAKES
jgi:hypothetical protein